MDVEKNAWRISAMLTCWFQSLGMQKGRGNFADCKSLLQSLHHWMASSRTSWSISNSTPTRSQTSCYECLCVSWLFAHACFLMKTSCTLLWLLLAKFTFVSWVDLFSELPTRSSLARWFGLIERCPRFLFLHCNACMRYKVMQWNKVGSVPSQKLVCTIVHVGLMF